MNKQKTFAQCPLRAAQPTGRLKLEILGILRSANTLGQPLQF